MLFRMLDRIIAVYVRHRGLVDHVYHLGYDEGQYDAYDFIASLRDA